MEQLKFRKGFFETKKEYDPCEKCGMWKTCISPKMKWTGQGKKKILMLGEGPGKNEDLQGKQFVGESGQYLDSSLNQFGLKLDEDFWKENSVRCRPVLNGRNRKPTKKEIRFCKQYVDETIAELKPKFIWLMGNTALDSFCLGRFTEYGKISRWRRRCIPDPKYNAWIIPMYHPAYILHKQYEKGSGAPENNEFEDEGYMDSDKLDMIFQKDLQWAVSCLNLDYPKFFEPEVIRIYEIKSLLHYLNLIQKEKPELYIDFETTGLRPYLEKHKILSISFSIAGQDGEVNTIAFPYQYRDFWKKDFILIQDEIQQIMSDPEMLKSAHNIKFEDIWSRKKLRVIPKGWAWDTMVSQHIIDGRGSTCGLKEQAYWRYGIENYEKEANKYLETEEGVEFNKGEEFDLDKLLIYNGYDTNLGYRLWKDQEIEIKKKQEPANELFFEGVKANCDLEENGIPINEKHFKIKHKEISKEIDGYLETIKDTDEYKMFVEKQNREPNLNPSKDLKMVLFDYGKGKSIKRTAKGFESVDEEVLEKLNTVFTINLLQMRKMEKARKTYIEQFLRNSYDNLMHSEIALHTTASYRGSMRKPSFQNVPIRNPEVREKVRSGIVPSKGNQLLESDYSALEVRIYCCYSKDETLIDDVNNPEVDVHRDQAMKLFFLKKEEVNEETRFHSKNGFVFPELYGSWYGSCAEAIWEKILDGMKVNDDLYIKKHLRNNGIYNLEDFTNHVKKVESEFWYRYHYSKEWQNRYIDEYNHKGYIEFFLGFRREGYLSKNQIINTPVQGTAFHCLLWSLNKLNAWIKAEKMKTKIIAQIHDSILKNLYPPEFKDIVWMTVKVMTEKIREHFDFLIVPLVVKIESSKVNGSWANMKPIEGMEGILSDNHKYWEAHKYGWEREGILGWKHKKVTKKT